VPYPTAAELRDESSGAARIELDKLSAGQLEALRQSAIGAVEDFTGQRFVAEVATRRVDGSGTGLLMLDRRLAVLDEIAATNAPTLNIDGVELSDGHDRIVVRQLSGVGWMLQRQYEWQGVGRDGQAFPIGNGNVTITGTWGWLDADWLPVGDQPAALANVRTALRTDMEDQALADANQLGPTIRAYRKLGVGEVRQGNVAAAIRNSASISPTIQRLLQRFVWTPGDGSFA
jgi:hypothetical protein